VFFLLPAVLEPDLDCLFSHAMLIPKPESFVVVWERVDVIELEEMSELGVGDLGERLVGKGLFGCGRVG
jgi:hypothetical protein